MKFILTQIANVWRHSLETPLKIVNEDRPACRNVQNFNKTET